MIFRVHRLVVLVAALLFISALPAFAAAPSVDVPFECTVIDTDGASHTYSGQYLGICALEAARNGGIVSAYTLQNFSFGLFLQSLNGISPGETEFWALSRNGVDASVGLTDLAVVEGDTLALQLTDWSANTKIGSPVEFSIGSLLPEGDASSSTSGGGAGEFLEDRLFSIEHAFDFLVAHQEPDGSFGSPMLTDWAAIAFGVETSECNDACPAARERLRAYVAHASVEASSATELARHIMALEALGINPYEAPESPVEALVALFDGVQVGDASLVNDDIFAIFPLMKAGYSEEDSMIQDIVTFILSKQKMNGSWEDSVDLTAAAIQALAPFSKDAALERAKEFLRRNQNDSGIFGINSFSLSWVLQAIGAFGERPEDWKKSGVTPFGYLGIFQQDDGGVEPKVSTLDTRIWATAYAIPAAFGKPWNLILKDFPKPLPEASAPAELTAVTENIPQETALAPATTPEVFAVSARVESDQEDEIEAAKTSPTSTQFALDEEEFATSSAQLAAVGSITDGLDVYLVLVLLLLLSALVGAFAFPPLSRLFYRLFR